MLEPKKHLLSAIIFWFFSWLSIEALAASETVEESFDVKAGGTLTIDSSQGSIEIDSWNKNQVHVEVEKNARKESRLQEFAINIEKKGNNVIVEGKSSGWNSRVSAQYRVKVPREYNLELSTGGGSITIGDLQGRVMAETSGGSIRVGDIDGNIEVDTSGGSISVGRVTGTAKVDTSGGSIKVAAGGKSVVADTSGGSIEIGPSEGTVSADTSGGSIRIAHAKGDVSADTSGGSITIEGSDGSAWADTSGGNITIDNVAGPIIADTSGGRIKISRARASVNADTAGGDITVELIEDSPKVDIGMDLDTAGGDVTVYLPEKVKASVAAKLELSRYSRDAQIYSDFPLAIRDNGDRIVGEGDINGGGDLIKISTSNGDIHIKKLR